MLKIFLALTFISGVAYAEMVPSSQIGNTKEKVNACVKRSSIKGKQIPFEISRNYLETSKKYHPDSVFVAIDGDSPQLIECYQREDSGRFEPASISPEQKFWRVVKSREFSPGFDAFEGKKIITDACYAAVINKININDIDHPAYDNPIKATLNSRIVVNGVKAARDDFISSGSIFYKGTGLDLKSKNYKCILSPMLDIKAVQIK